PIEPSPETQALLDEALARMGRTPESLPACAPPTSEAERDIPRVPPLAGQVRHASSRYMRIRLSPDLYEMVDRTLRMAEVALGDQANRSQCIELLLNHFLATWASEAVKAAREHPLLERDSWQCTTPGCTNRASLHGHHLLFKSQGGGDEPGNQSTVCACHHLQGIHTGRIRARGQAPDGIVWEMGIRPDGAASRLYLNDTLVA
ncbi:MAG TPA: hypothetical protein VGO93_30845, partial [Candidatus Xenobia bacterium]